MSLFFKYIIRITMFLTASAAINSAVLAKILPTDSGVYGLSISDCRQNMVERDHIFELLEVWPAKKAILHQKNFARLAMSGKLDVISIQLRANVKEMMII